MAVKLPDMNPEILAKLVFCLKMILSAAMDHQWCQDSIGICMPGLVRHYYDNRFWPDKFETCNDEEVLLGGEPCLHDSDGARRRAVLW